MRAHVTCLNLRQRGLPVGIGFEDDLPGVASLSNVLRSVGRDDAGWACYGKTVSRELEFLRIRSVCRRIFGTKLGMGQGAAQFCRMTAFSTLNGYDEYLFMGEDVDFYWRLKRLSLTSAGYLKLLDDVPVFPSARRFDNTPIWQTLIWTNPVFIAPLRKTRAAWAGWYVRPPR